MLLPINFQLEKQTFVCESIVPVSYSLIDSGKKSVILNCEGKFCRGHRNNSECFYFLTCSNVVQRFIWFIVARKKSRLQKKESHALCLVDNSVVLKKYPYWNPTQYHAWPCNSHLAHACENYVFGKCGNKFLLFRVFYTEKRYEAKTAPRQK